MSLDLYLFSVLNSFAGQGPILDIVIVFFATYLPFILVGWFVLYLAYRKDLSHRSKVMGVVFAFVAGSIARFLVTSPIRFFFPRLRPLAAMDISHLLTIDAPSFPSGHASFLFGFSTIVFFYNRKLGIAFYVCTVLVCIARIAAGVHYPSDMVAGCVVGVLSGLAVIYLIKKPALRALKWSF
ncbi:MAG: Phosphatase [Parcubacteria bacterium C7867-008]|nr:MAG: Phosphatase [Parcubacteria bacterium C7867-008]